MGQMFQLRDVLLLPPRSPVSFLFVAFIPFTERCRCERNENDVYVKFNIIDEMHTVWRIMKLSLSRLSAHSREFCVGAARMQLYAAC